MAAAAAVSIDLPVGAFTGAAKSTIALFSAALRSLQLNADGRERSVNVDRPRDHSRRPLRINPRKFRPFILFETRAH